MRAPRPSRNSPLISPGSACGPRDSARPSAAFWFRRKSWSSADVVRIFISVGTGRVSPMRTSGLLGARVAETHARAHRGDAGVVGARLDRQLLLGGLDQRRDRLGVLHLAERA